MRFIVVCFFGFLTIAGHASIQIENDESDCLDGWISMDVTIKVDGERFEFDPSCSFSFDENFKTKAGNRCEVEAGMCSSFSPQKKLQVKCSNGAREEIDIHCPRK
ncbi:MAG: hypothetical protein AAF203_01575 [Pseudomonadota bacterium]